MEARHEQVGPFEYPYSIAVNRDGIGAYTVGIGDYMRLSYDGGMNWTDSIHYSDLLSKEELEGYTDQKVVTAGQNGIFLLLSKIDAKHSIIARVDILSDVPRDPHSYPQFLDLR